MRSKRLELILDTLKGVKGAKDLTKATDGLADSLGDTAREGERAGRAVDKAGDEMSESARAAAKMDREIRQLTGSLRELAIAQALTGESSAKQVREQESQLRRLSKNRNLLGDGKEPAEGFVASLSAQMGPLLAKMPISAPVLGAIVAAGAAAAPLLGAAISGAIIGGAGIGGVVGGLALAQRDERVGKAIDGLGDRLERRLLTAAGGFVHPALAGIKEIERALDSIDMEAIFRQSAKYIPVLTAGISSAITDLGDGVESLVRNANGPVAAISQGLAGIGQHVGDALERISDNGPEAAAGLTTMFGVINSVIDSTTNLVNLLTELYGWSQKIGGDMALQAFLKLTGAETKGLAAETEKLTRSQVDASSGIMLTGDAAADLKIRQQALTAVQKEAKDAQDALASSLDSMAPKQGRAAELTNALRTASQNLFGAQIAGVEANEAYQASWDALSGSVKEGGRSLSANTAAGRSNRDALQSLLAANNEMYFANIAQGESTDKASAKHKARTEQVRKEARQLGLNKTETQELINTYGKIPGKKATNLVIEGLDRVVEVLNKLYMAQRALAEGKTEEQVRKTGLTFRGFSEGGWTGPGAKHQPAGVVHADEFVVNKAARRNVERQAPGFLDSMNKQRSLPGYAGGGRVAPVDTSRRWPYDVNVGKTHLMSMEDALSRVTPAVPSGGRTSDWIERVARMLVPGIRTLSKDRPGARTLNGSRSYHSMGRAVDFEPSEKLARLWNERYKSRTKEFISPYQRYNINNGRDWTATGAVWNQHNFAGGNPHDHIAMLNGGMVREPVFGVGRSGRTYSFAENGRPERVLSAGQTARGGAPVTIAPVIHINGSNLSAKQIATEVSRHIASQADVYSRSVA